MSRVETKSTKLDSIIGEYGKHNTEFNNLKKVVEEEKNQIKQIFEDTELDEYTAGGYKVSVTSIEKVTLNEDKMLEILLADWKSRYGEDVPCPYIETKLVINMDKLEAVLYNGEIPKDTMLELNKCKSVSTSVRLNCKQVKGE